MILLLGMQVSEFAFALSGHPPLCLHHLLGVAGATGRLVMSLGGVKVLQVGARGTARFVEVVDRVGARAALAVGGTACYESG